MSTGSKEDAAARKGEKSKHHGWLRTSQALTDILQQPFERR